jgi:hypothetical protein
MHEFKIKLYSYSTNPAMTVHIHFIKIGKKSLGVIRVERGK